MRVFQEAQTGSEALAHEEWLINVPILIILAGTVALGRPAQEVAEPLIVARWVLRDPVRAESSGIC